MIVNFFAGIAAALKALFRAEDDVAKITPEGWEILGAWKEENPYKQVFQNARRLPEDSLGASPVQAALVFARGRDLGSICYLREGTYTLGTSCSNSIVITTSVLSERKLRLQIKSGKLYAETSNPDSPIYINGHPAMKAELVDQDEISFSGAVFFYQQLFQVPGTSDQAVPQTGLTFDVRGHIERGSHVGSTN